MNKLKPVACGYYRDIYGEVVRRLPLHPHRQIISNLLDIFHNFSPKNTDLATIVFCLVSLK